jgi:predicted  nucleic acid-binding Zn-ribbon protein
MKQQKMMNEQDVIDALKNAKELPQLKDQFQLLIEEIQRLEYRRNSLRTSLSALQNQISTAEDSLRLYESTVDDKIQNIAEAHKKFAVREYKE